MKKLQINIDGQKLDRAHVRLTEDDGSESVYAVPVNHLAELLDKRLERKSELVFTRLGDVPNGYVDAMIADEKNYCVALIAPSRIRPYLYQSGSNEHSFLIPFPDILCIFHVKEGKFHDGECYAMMNGSDQLYRFPFANVYDNGNICWGGNARHEVKFSESDQLMSLFLESGFNTHLYSAGNTTLRKENIEDLIRFLSAQSDFKSEWLVPLKEKTVRKIITNYFKIKQRKG